MKKIECSYCALFLGEIRDASLRKGIYFVCRKCRIAAKTSEPIDLPESFRNIFK